MPIQTERAHCTHITQCIDPFQYFQLPQVLECCMRGAVFRFCVRVFCFQSLVTETKKKKKRIKCRNYGRAQGMRCLMHIKNKINRYMDSECGKYFNWVIKVNGFGFPLHSRYFRRISASLFYLHQCIEPSGIGHRASFCDVCGTVKTINFKFPLSVLYSCPPMV